MGHPTRGFTLPPDWADCERGNTYLVSYEGDEHIAWLTLDGDLRLEISIVLGNYPALEVMLVESTDAELADHILKKLSGWFIRKLNLDDPRLAKLSAGDEIPESDEDDDEDDEGDVEE